jgi:hypothetical protein
MGPDVILVLFFFTKANKHLPRSIHRMYHSSAIYKVADKQGPYKRMKKCAYCHVLKRCKYGPTFVNTIRRPLWRKASVKHFLWICGCGWKERRNPNSCWTRRQDTGQLFIMNFCGCWKSDVCCSFLCLGVFCLFAGLWCLKFAIQWRWAFELALVMERVGCCNLVGSWMRNANLLAKDWLLREIGWRWGRAEWTINKGVRVFRKS